jgi:hypothetical protein
VAKLPEPPPAATLAAVPPAVRSLVAGTELWRLYFRGGEHPTVWEQFRSWGPTAARFDHHLPPPRDQARAVLYAAASALTSVAEVFQDTRVIDRRRNQPSLAGFRLAHAVGLLDLTGTWPTRAGASMALASGPRPRAQRWARAIYEAYPSVEGLYYPSSMHANAPAVALFERARSAVAGPPVFQRALIDPSLLAALKTTASTLGFGLV